MKCYPQRRVPVMLSSPHEAAPPFHEDWTIIDGSSRDPDKWELELRLRGVRNRLIREDLEAGLAVFYRSTGSSMWPLVQSHDGCTFHPIQAATATATICDCSPRASPSSTGPRTHLERTTLSTIGETFQCTLLFWRRHRKKKLRKKHNRPAAAAAAYYQRQLQHHHQILTLSLAHPHPPHDCRRSQQQHRQPFGFPV